MAKMVDSAGTLTVDIEIDMSVLDEALVKAKELEAVLNRINPHTNVISADEFEMLTKRVAEQFNKALAKAFSFNNG